LLVSFDAQALNLAIPRLTTDLHPSATQLLWIVDIYVFLGAGSLITMGALGDRIGRRRMLFIGATVFAVASLGSVFLVAVPVAALLLLLGPFLLPRSRTETAARLDLISAVTSLAAVLLAVYGLKRIAQNGWHPLPVIAIVFGILLGVFFIRRQRRRDDPMVDLAMFRRKAFSVALTSNTLSFFVLYGTQLWIAQYLQVVLGLSPLRAGIYTIPAVLGYLAGAAIAPTASRLLSPYRAIGVGLMVVCVGFVLLAGVASGHGLLLLITGSVVFSIGLAPVYV